MNDSSDSVQVKRGRPRKNHDQDCLGDKLTSRVRLSRSEVQYRYLLTQYISSNFNQKMKSMIHKFLELFRFKIQYNVGLFVLIEISVKEMMLSEIEFAAFAVIFSKIDLEVIEVTNEELIKLCMFSVKVKIDDRKEIISKMRTKLELEIIDITQKLADYIPYDDFTLRELNEWLIKLSESCQFTSVNYSFLVNDLIILSPPYKLKPNGSRLKNKKKHRKEVGSLAINEDIKRTEAMINTQEEEQELNNNLPKRPRSLSEKYENRLRKIEESILKDNLKDRCPLWQPDEDADN